MIKFIKMSIEGREYTKFVFSHTVSECLKLLQTLGQKFKISREDMAHLDIKLILDAYSNLAMSGLGEVMQDGIDKNKSRYRYTEGVRLPSLITKPENVYSFYIEQEEPNYVTLKNVTAQISLETNGFGGVEGKIVFIQSADPGYDFLFSKNIAGLVTQFGGGNSHMAIRCAELGIPAVIGAGEKLFAFWANKKVIKIDCASKQVHLIS